MIGTPLANTTRAASGSAQMLNSAAGVTFPQVSEPPMIVKRATRDASDGSRRSAVATFVSGPTAMTCRSVTDRESSMITSTAWASTSGIVGSGRSGPSRPVAPWTSGAKWASRTSGRSHPAATGIPVSPPAPGPGAR